MSMVPNQNVNLQKERKMKEYNLSIIDYLLSEKGNPQKLRQTYVVKISYKLTPSV